MAGRSAEYAGPFGIWIVLPLAAAAAAFAPCLAFPTLYLDDPLYLRALESGVTTPEAGYVVLMPALVHAALGGSSVALHAANVVGHLACVVLVFALARRLRMRITEAALVAAIMAVHPIVAEPVAWVAGLKDVLAAALSLGALLAWGPGRRRAGLVLLLGILAMLSKPHAAMLPLILIGADRWMERGDRPARAVIAALALFAVVVAAYAIVQNRAIGGLAVGQALSTRVLNVGLVFFEQARNWLVPLDLVGRYMPLAAWSDPRVVVGLFGFLAALALPLLLSKRPLLALAALIAIGFYLPTSNLVPIARTMADSYLYLPTAGVALAVVLLARKGGKVALALLSLVPIAYLPFARARAEDYRSNVALFEPILERYPDSPDAWKWLADAHVIDGAPARAVPLYQELEARFPDYRRGTANLGVAWLRLGKLDRALGALLRAPKTPKALDSLADVLLLRGHLPPPEHHARSREALLRRTGEPPEDPRLLNNLAVLLAGLGERDTAVRLLERASAATPEIRANLERMRSSGR